MCLYQAVKPLHNNFVAASRGPLLGGLRLGEAINHSLYQRLLQSTRSLGIGDDLGGRLCQVPGRRMKPLKLLHRGWPGNRQERIARWLQIIPGNYPQEGIYIFQRQ